MPRCRCIIALTAMCQFLSFWARLFGAGWPPFGAQRNRTLRPYEGSAGARGLTTAENPEPKFRLFPLQVWAPGSCRGGMGWFGLVRGFEPLVAAEGKWGGLDWFGDLHLNPRFLWRVEGKALATKPRMRKVCLKNASVTGR